MHTSDTPSTPVQDKRQILLIFGGLLVAMLLSSLDQMIFSSALPTIVGEGSMPMGRTSLVTRLRTIVGPHRTLTIERR